MLLAREITKKMVRNKLLDGLILLKRKADDPCLKEIIESDFPFVMVSHEVSSNHYNYVDTDNL